MVLRLLYVSNDPAQAQPVSPESVFVTTFTEKAAKNLEDRILNYRASLVAVRPALGIVDVSKLRVGTLHGLANDILQEYRAPNYQNVRLMDEFEQALFVREHMSLIKTRNPPAEVAFWQRFPWLFGPHEWKPTYTTPPNRWKSTSALLVLLNRIVEDRVSVTALRGAGGQLARLADLYDEYVQHLSSNFRCDFSQLQGRFLEFLATPLGQSFLHGDGTASKPGIKWVLVDEYQDTNPVQEEIYFRLAANGAHNLVVVGDDDQAMYRFRGGSVECMVTFDHACNSFLGISPAAVIRYSLVDNFRSHGDIVALFNDYITSFPLMTTPGARSPKPPIVAKRNISASYTTAIGRIEGRTLPVLAGEFAQAVADLISHGVVNDASECCLLLKSTKESPHNAGHYADALRARGIEVYNPRNKTFMEQEEVQGLLGAILAIVDPRRRYALEPSNAISVPLDAELAFRTTYNSLAASNPELVAYVARANAAIIAKAGNNFDASLQELAYYLMSLEPFSSWQRDPIRRVRLARLTQLLEAYNATPVLDPATGKPRPNVTRGFIRSSTTHPGEASEHWLHSFYHLFLTYIIDAGMNDEEDADVICPPGMVPIMTMHQSKGLEFPFVFVGHMGENWKIGASHYLETLFSAYPANPARSFPRRPEADRAEMDLVRQYYVAYSRAEYALIFLGIPSHFNSQTVPCGPAPRWLKSKTNLL
jgi:DNA helicase-2/ATP-dependent DNA helicase PcrA